MASIPGDPPGGIAETAIPSFPPRSSRFVAFALGLVGATALAVWLLPPRAVVESEPSGALVFIDDREVGRSPLSLTSWVPTSWQVRVQASGHAPWTGTAYASLGQTTLLQAVLVPLPGQLSIEAEPLGARVEIDGVDRGPAPLALPTISAGAHGVVISAEGYQDWREEIRIAPGGTASRRILLRARPARLTLTTRIDGAIVFVDDEERGAGSEEIEVAPGDREIRIEAEGYRPWRQLVQLLADERRVLDITLQRLWPDPRTASPSTRSPSS